MFGAEAGGGETVTWVNSVLHQRYTFLLVFSLCLCEYEAVTLNRISPGHGEQNAAVAIQSFSWQLHPRHADAALAKLKWEIGADMKSALPDD